MTLFHIIVHFGPKFKPMYKKDLWVCIRCATVHYTKLFNCHASMNSPRLPYRKRGSLDVNFLLFIVNDANHLVESNPDNVIKKVYMFISGYLNLQNQSTCRVQIICKN